MSVKISKPLSKSERKEIRKQQNHDWKIRTKNLIAKLDEDDEVYDPVIISILYI